MIEINKDYNLVLFTQIVIMAIGIGWLSLYGITVAGRYTTMFVVGISLLTLTLLFVREEQRTSIFNYIKIPFTVSTISAAVLYLLGWAIPILIRVGTGFSISNYQVPLAAATINKQIEQTFQTLQTTASPFFNFFVTVWTAGTLEEFLWAFILMFVGGLLTVFVLTMISKYSKTPKMYNKNAITIGALLFTVTTFMLAHQLNSTYTTVGMFIAAGIFRLVLNVGIYYFGLVVSFTVGLHQANNAIYFYNTYGRETTLQALTSVGGVIIMIYFALLTFYVVANLRYIPEVLRRIKNDMLKRFS